MPNGNLDTEKYKQELMRLYSRSTSAEEKQVTQPVPEEINGTDTEAPDDTVYAEHTEEDSNGAEEDNIDGRDAMFMGNMERTCEPVVINTTISSIMKTAMMRNPPEDISTLAFLNGMFTFDDTGVLHPS